MPRRTSRAHTTSTSTPSWPVRPGRGGRHPLPQAHAVAAAAQRCGADNDSRIVVYDQGPSYGAARAWWVLRYFGASDVRVLDGGLAAWRPRWTR